MYTALTKQSGRERELRAKAEFRLSWRFLQENMPISYHTTYQLVLKDKMERTNLQKSVFQSNDYTNAIFGVEKSLNIENVPMKMKGLVNSWTRCKQTFSDI